MSTILRSSAHAHPQWRNSGGGRRSAQIEEILSGHGITWIDQINNPPFGRLQLLRTKLKLRCTEPVIRLGRNRRLVHFLADDYLRHRWFFENNPDIAAFLVEECVDFARIRAAHDSGVGLICCPHNFETWQANPPRDYYTGEGLPHSFHREACFAALSDVVFCISREEQWLLTNYGATTDFLPYYPPAAHLAALTEVRRARVETPPAGHEFFAIANGANLKNQEGLAALAGLMAEMPADSGFQLHVGGFDSDALHALFSTERCTFHGTLSDSEMTGLMRRCRATIIHQTSGTGALTRITDLLCAGIPVIASPHAARSAYGTSGVHLFHDAAELAVLLRTPLPMPPRPMPDEAAGLRLAAWVRRLATRQRRAAS
jgi:hypothetical protein